MANTHKPHVSLWAWRAEAPSGSEGVVVDRIGPGLDIPSDPFAMVWRLALRAHRAFVERVATPRDLCSGGARLVCRPIVAPVS